MGGSEQVLTDAAALASRTQATVTYQIATALQTTIGSLLDPAYTLVGVVPFVCNPQIIIFSFAFSREPGVRHLPLKFSSLFKFSRLLVQRIFHC